MIRAISKMFQLNSKQGIALLTATLVVSGASATEYEKLSSPIKLNLKKTTVSGLSSGGYMANQFHVAHSDWVQGAGIIAAGPNYCAQNSLTTALSHCIGVPKKEVDLDGLNNQISKWESQGKVNKLENLKDDKVWILGGTLDQKVSPIIVDLLSKQYSSWIPESQIHQDNNKAFAHHFPTLKSGTDCKKSESPFIANCGFDAAGEILNYLHPGLSQPKQAESQNIKRIETDNLPDDLGDTLGDNAYVYVPDSCSQGSTCQLHISFHGCNQNEDAIETQFVTQTGYNRWAEANDIVVLYPQTKNSNMMPFNPQGCWDWWGYTDANYATLKGKQIMAIEALVTHITGKKHGE